MTVYTVHLYREMKLRFDRVEAETMEMAAESVRDKMLRDADDFSECEGEDISALVDVEGDEEYSLSQIIDFEGKKAEAAMRDALSQIARLKMDGEDGFDLTNDDAVDSLHSCIELARDTLAKVRAA